MNFLNTKSKLILIWRLKVTLISKYLLIRYKMLTILEVWKQFLTQKSLLLHLLNNYSKNLVKMSNGMILILDQLRKTLKDLNHCSRMRSQQRNTLITMMKELNGWDLMRLRTLTKVKVSSKHNSFSMTLAQMKQYRVSLGIVGLWVHYQAWQARMNWLEVVEIGLIKLVYRLLTINQCKCVRSEFSHRFFTNSDAREFMYCGFLKISSGVMLW